MAVEPARRQFTVDEYYQMASAGILSENDRVELIEGEIIQMPPIGGRHASCVDRIAELFFGAFRGIAQVRVQNPLRLDGLSEPVPDVMLLKRRSDFYAERHPFPQDVLLLVEVSDTTVAYDRRVKLPLYARLGVGEVWIVDLDRSIIDLHREPTSEGYRLIETRRRGERLGPSAFPDQTFSVDDILG